jgi:hypothetical protein
MLAPTGAFVAVIAVLAARPLTLRSTVFSHASTVVTCNNCQQVLCQPTGGKARLTEGGSPHVVFVRRVPADLPLRLLVPPKELDSSFDQGRSLFFIRSVLHAM